MKEIKIPGAVAEVMEVLHQNGEEAYIVGGCVRDSIMGKVPKDWDITTSATPEQMKCIFPKTVDTGIKHGTITVLHQHEAIEITTFRVDGTYEDHRRPKEVSFTKSLKEDVARRDFTVNAMAYSKESGLMDFFEGQADLAKHKIRCVGKAEERFEEDALRMMRAVRFAAALNFEIEKETAAAIVVKKDLIKAVSQERIRIEFIKTLDSDHAGYLAYFVKYGLAAHFLPEINLPAEESDSFYDKLHRLPAGLTRLAFLMQRLGTGEEAAKKAKRILKRMTFDNHTIQVVRSVIEYGDDNIVEDAYSVRCLLSKLGEEAARIAIWIAWVNGRISLQVGEELISEALDKPLGIKDLAVNGRDLLELGLQQGEELGNCLEELLQYVLQFPDENQKEVLLKRASQHCKK